MTSKCRMIELRANEEETEFGIRIAGDQGFKAITTCHTNMMFEKIIDSATMLGLSVQLALYARPLGGGEVPSEGEL